MDSGGWIMLMMLGGTGLLLLFGAYPRRPTQPAPIIIDGWRGVAEALQQEVEERRRESGRLKSQIIDLRMELDAMDEENIRLATIGHYWRARYSRDIKRSIGNGDPSP
jgi:hypothetical protein